MKLDFQQPLCANPDLGYQTVFDGAASQLAEAERLAGLGSWTWRSGERNLSCSAGLMRLADCGGLATEASLRSCFRYILPEDRRNVFARIREAQRTGGSGSFEFRLKGGNGEGRILSASIRTGSACDGRVVSWGSCQDITATRGVKVALDRSESRWEMAFETARQGVWDFDLATGTVHHSRTWRLLRGMDADDERGDTHAAWLERLHPDDRDRILELIARQQKGELERVYLEYRERHRDGHQIWISSRGAPIEWWPDGKPKRIIGTDTDITQRKLAEADMARLSRRLELALEVSRTGVFEADLEDGSVFWDNRVREMYGVPCDGSEIGPVDWERSLHPEDAERAQALVRDAVERQGQYDFEFRIVRPHGEIRTIRTRGVFYRDADGRRKVLGANWDVTAEVAAQHDLERAKTLAEARNVELEAVRARIEHNALHDTLTGLPNRRYLDGILSKHAASRAKHGGSIALLHIDLDRFKQINDTLGHAAGDAMLVHVAKLLRANLGGGEFVARVGGDEFVVVCPFAGNSQRLTALAESIIEQVRRPIPYEGHLCRFGASVGIATQSGAAIDPKLLLIDADIALYRAKGRGKNRYEFFSEALQTEAVNTKRVADDILRGIEQNEFVPFYQPLLDAQTLDIVGVEALARWQHPTEGTLAPASFLKIAEDLNALTDIDRLILEQALADYGRWSAAGLPVASVSVNVSFRRLHDQQLVDSLRGLRIEPGTLSFELLESIFLDEPDESVSWNLDQIRELGIAIDIDDFGTGHASIVSLLKLNPRRFKIDRQFLTAIATSQTQRRLVRSLIDIGKSLGIIVVAEGVETMEQAHILRELGCDIVQGYAFARPMPADALEALLRTERWREAS
ncbi:MAG: EAL domain-containing protein [Devosia sp.]|nr:EAL domain-containing protein [Devosia sp.]